MASCSAVLRLRREENNSTEIQELQQRDSYAQKQNL